MKRRIALAAGIAFATACGGEGPTTSAPPAAPAEVKVPTASQATISVTTSELSVAIFDSEHLDSCWTAMVVLGAPSTWRAQASAMPLEKAPIMLIEEAFAFSETRESALVDQRSYFTSLLHALVTGDAKALGDTIMSQVVAARERTVAAGDPGAYVAAGGGGTREERFQAFKERRVELLRMNPTMSRSSRDELLLKEAGPVPQKSATPAPSAPATEEKIEAAMAQFRKVLADQTWPPESLAADVRAGRFAKVDSCVFPNRTALGLCIVDSESTDNGEQVLGWTLHRIHYGVRETTDSDAALRSCLQLGGKWSAPSADNMSAARERLRQRVGQLRGLINAQ